MAQPKKILFILTGGTICSFADENGEQRANTAKAKTVIVKNFRNSDSAFASQERVEFVIKRPLNILSENMTVRHWNTLLRKLKTYELSEYDGVILLHGTDTLAYTASLLSLVSAGEQTPLFLVSAQLPLNRPESNGNDNFRTAVEQICGGIAPNVYAVYRNREVQGDTVTSTMYIHYGSHLRQCERHSDNFYSDDMTPLKRGEVFAGTAANGTSLLPRLEKLQNCVLKIEPYVGLDYSRYSLRGVKAVLHHTYHSETVAVNPYGKAISKDAVRYLQKRCAATEPPTALFIEPCRKASDYAYETTGTLRRSGVGTSWRTTSETAYVKLLIGCSLGLEGDALQAFMDQEINGEFLR